MLLHKIVDEQTWTEKLDGYRARVLSFGESRPSSDPTACRSTKEGIQLLAHPSASPFCPSQWCRGLVEVEQAWDGSIGT